MENVIVENGKRDVNSAIIASGMWGTCSWSLGDYGDLIIGAGAGDSLTSVNGAPWAQYKDQIVTVSFTEVVVMQEESSLSYMFANCSQLKRVDFTDFDSFGVVAMNGMFHSCGSLEEVIFGEDFDVSAVTNFSKMFFDCSSLETMDLSSFDTSSAVDMNSMFEGCSNILSLDLSSWTTPNLIGMSLMFRNCNSVEKIDISGFDTSKVTGISGLFSSCSNLIFVDMSNFDTSNVTSMISMFMNCNSLEYLSLSKFKTSKAIDMSLMFCNCSKLKALDLSGFDTSGVVDMSMMFASCVELGVLDLTGFNTSKVTNMQNMFMYCSSLPVLDLTDFDTGNVEDMTDMFTGCDNLSSLTIGSGFSFTGNGTTSCHLPGSASLKYDELKWIESSTGEEYGAEDIPGNKAGTYYIKGREFDISYDANGGLGHMPESQFTLTAESTPEILENVFLSPKEGFLFKEWNTRRDGKGRAYQAGDILDRLCSNVTLYAIWASIPTIHAPEYLEAIEYGSKLNLGTPVIDDNNGEIISSGVEISPDGLYDWQHFDPESIPSVDYDGFYLRFYAENFVGVAYSDTMIIYIDKAVYNMEDVHWEYDDDLVYNGQVKTLFLADLPEGVTAEYYGNQAVDIGQYVAGAKLFYDTINYQMPPEVEECKWSISKGILDMSKVTWNYSEPFSYDGEVKSVYMIDLPEGIVASYENNAAVDVGRYEAIVAFAVENESNYEVPEAQRFVWEIGKSSYDMSAVRWQYEGSLIYNGELQGVYLQGLPTGVSVYYEQNTAIDAGRYEATAIFVIEDEHNYAVPEPMGVSWEITKASYDMSPVKWQYEEPFTYNGEIQGVYLMGLPAGVTAEYEGANGTEAGQYTAVAVLAYDELNYEKPCIEAVDWQIVKADYDMSPVHWNYEHAFTYDGTTKVITLENLPAGVIAEYSGNSEVNAGVYTAAAVLTVADENNYNVPAIEGCSWEIAKAYYDIGDVYWNYNDDIYYDGDMKAVTLEGLPQGVTVVYSGNSAVNAGVYNASVELTAIDPTNVQVPEVKSLEWRIHKAVPNMDEVYWERNEDFVYDNEIKSVFLTGLPDGVVAEYEGNSERLAGEYEAKAKLIVADPENYEIPEVVDFPWSIEKAEYDMSGVSWEYDGQFVYDGNSKSVKLLGLPNGITAEYIDNTAIYVGTYIASVIFGYDERNYKMPDVGNCRWDIVKADYDMSEVKWNYDEPFFYDGEEKVITLSGLPEGVTAEYFGNIATIAGVYEAGALLTIDDENNYNVPTIRNCTWEIRKAEYDMSRVVWMSDEELVYDGEYKFVFLDGLPDGVDISYEGNTAIDAGQYTASAVTIVEDEEDYAVPVIEDYVWVIRKADYDMSEVLWVYTDELIYDGETKSVFLEGLPEGVTAVYEGNTAVAAGEYEAIASFVVDEEENFNVPEPIECQWVIEKNDYDMSDVRWDYDGNLFYDERIKSVTLTGLPEGVTAQYSGNTETNVGSYEAVATFTIDDEESFKVPHVDNLQWEIKKGEYDMSYAEWNYYDGKLSYDGSEKTVTLKGLPQGVTANYSNNNKIYAGSYTAEATFDIVDEENYNVPTEKTLYWEIKKGSYDISGIEWNYSEPFTYDGSEKSVELVGLDDGVIAEYADNINVNAGVYIATAILNIDSDNYETPIMDDCRWTINKAMPDISDVQWDYSDPFVYDGEEKQVRLLGLPDGVTARYSECNMIEAGTYTANAALSVEDPNNYAAPTVERCYWEIKKTAYDMSDVHWDYREAFIYDRTVKSIFLTGLPEGITANYENNSGVNAGTYTATVNFVYDSRNYEPPIIDDCTWEIKKTEYDMSEAYWQYDDDFVFDNTQKSISLSGLPSGVAPIYDGNSAVDAGVYTASAQFVFDEKNYETPSVENCTWEIKKASYDMTNVNWNYQEPFVYDGEEKSVALEEPQKPANSFKRFFKMSKEDDEPIGLPEGVSATYTGNTGVEAGEYTASAILSLENSNNYEIPAVDDCRWEIKKAVHDMSRVSWNYQEEFIYDGEEKIVYLMGLPQGVIADYSGNTGVEAGEYEAEVTLSIDDPHNYEMPEPIEGCQWSIGKGRYDMSSVRWNYSGGVIYDGREKSIEIVGLPEEVTASCSGNSAIDAGTYTANAVLSLEGEDAHNYEIPVMESFKWRIDKAAYDMSEVEWDYSSAFEYDEKAKTITLNNLPEGLTAYYSDNSKIDAGAYIATVEFDYDKANYEEPVMEGCKWKINKAHYDMDDAAWNYEDAFTYDGKEKSVEMTGLPEDVIAKYTDNTAINAGQYTARVDLKYDEVNYFEPIAVKTCLWEIKKIKPEFILETTSYVKALSDERFHLGVNTDADEIKYEVADKDVITVADSGDAFIKGLGKTTVIITVGGDNFEPLAEELTVEIIDAK